MNGRSAEKVTSRPWKTLTAGSRRCVPRNTRGRLRRYAARLLRAIVHWREACWQLSVDGERSELAGYSVAVANSGVFGGGMYLAPAASLEDGLLDVVTIAAQPRRSYVRGLPRVFRGTHVNDPAVRIVQGAEIRFSADRPFTAYADGDPIAELPVTVSVLPRSLRVVAPR